MRERDIERDLVRQAKSLQGEVRKIMYIGHRGAPDRLLMMPKGILVWVELKAPGEKPEPHQLREHERMRKMGQRVEVIDSLEGVDNLMGEFR